MQFRNMHDKSALLEYGDIVSKLLALDLDQLRDVLAPHYSNTGRKAKNQPELFRALILMQDLRIPPNKLIHKLQHNFVLRSACGFLKSELPGIASLYDFMERITGKETSPCVRKRRRKPAKDIGTGKKMPLKRPNITARIKDRIVAGRRFSDPLARILNKILSLVVTQSKNLGLLGEALDISGDGTCILTGASHYGKKACGCKTQGIYDCDCPRKFSDPRASWGWDSHKGCYYYGYSD